MNSNKTTDTCILSILEYFLFSLSLYTRKTEKKKKTNTKIQSQLFNKLKYLHVSNTNCKDFASFLRISRSTQMLENCPIAECSILNVFAYEFFILFTFSIFVCYTPIFSLHLNINSMKYFFDEFDV